MKTCVGFVGLLTLGVAAALGHSEAAHANLILNGNFDLPDVAGSFVTQNSAPAGFGWTLVSDGTPNGTATTGLLGVDVINTLWVGTGGTANPDGIDQSLDIDRTSSISQTFATMVGQAYLLEFEFSHNFFAQSASGKVSVDGAGSLISEALLHDTANNASNMQWAMFSRTFVADSVATTLKLEGALANNNLGFVVDDVRVTAVPEPTTGSLLLSGLLAGAAWKRRAARRGSPIS